MRRNWLFAAASLTWGCTSTAIPQAAPDRDAPKAIVETTPLRSAQELVVGRWQMIAEEPASGEGAIYEQQRRLLSLGADSSYSIENYVEARSGEWHLDGSTLALDEIEIELVDVDEARLVLIEAVPEIYLRGGPPQQARMTYRRISERELGPMMGAELIESVPQPGSYAAAYTYRMDKLPTMEMTVGESIDGHARLVLTPKGTATGCFGVAHSSSGSVSKYASDDGEYHSHEHGERGLVGWSGRWTVSGPRASIKAERSWRGACAGPSDGHVTANSALEFECTALAPNDALPVATLACRVVAGSHMLDQLALNPADTERAGPYTLQSDPMAQISTALGRPWLMLGAGPGLRVESEDGRRTTTPSVSFAPGPVDFVEARYLEAAH